MEDATVTHGWTSGISELKSEKRPAYKIENEIPPLKIRMNKLENSFADG